MKKALLLCLILCLVIPYALAEETVEWVSDTERFVLTQETLRLESLLNGRWQTVWDNPLLIPESQEKIQMNYWREDSQHHTSRFVRMEHELLTLWAGEECPHLSITLSRDDGPWMVNDYQDEHSGLYAYLFDDLVIVNWTPFTAMDKASLYLGQIDRSAATFDPQSIRQWREAVGVSEESLGRAAQMDCIAGAEALYLSPNVACTCPVHVFPSADSPRSADGRAAVSLNDWSAVLCREGDWLLMLYATGRSSYRTGWVDSCGDEVLQQAASVSMPARFTEESGTVRQKTTLFDDPINQTGTVLTLNPGDKISLLARDWADMAYAEVQRNGLCYRGFIKTQGLE